MFEGSLGWEERNRKGMVFSLRSISRGSINKTPKGEAFCVYSSMTSFSRALANSVA
jgi:hypothetical protein